jgi:hypothetical protein
LHLGRAEFVGPDRVMLRATEAAARRGNCIILSCASGLGKGKSGILRARASVALWSRPQDDGTRHRALTQNGRTAAPWTGCVVGAAP